MELHMLPSYTATVEKTGRAEAENDAVADRGGGGRVLALAPLAPCCCRGGGGGGLW